VSSALAYLDAHPSIVLLLLGVFGAAVSASAAATRATHPRLSAWLGFFAAALPADVARMNPGAAPKGPAAPPKDQ
jgi:hypothetical protein